MVSVKDFGAVGDGTTDDSTAINNALAASNNIYFPSGTYLATTITIPNKAIYLKGDGMYETIIQSNTGSYNYLFASAAYVNNATTGNNQLIVENMAFDGNNVCTNVFVLYGFYSEFRYCLFQNALSSGTGAALLVTSNGISGSNCSTTLVENRIVNCRLIANGTSAGLGMVDSGFKCTDMFVLNNIFSGGTSNVVNLLAMAGTIFSNNHVYGGTSSFNELSIGTRIENNYFETKVVVDDFKYPLVSISNNEFLGILQVNFGSGLSYATLVLTDNTFTGASAYILHNFFASSRDIIVMGGSFDSSTPIVWSNGSSTGRVTFNNVYQYATGNYGTGTYSGVGYMLSGSGTAATGNIGKILWQNTYPTTGTWIVGDIVYNTAPTSGGNIGWVCTTSGTPGIWKTFGAIS